MSRRRSAVELRDSQDLVKLFKDYLYQVRVIYTTGNYTEMTFRTALETLIRKLNTDLNPIQESARSDKFGAPDFTVYKKSVKIGYIETKELTIDLDTEIKSPQVKKYIENIDNIILTNYSRFILIRNGQTIFTFLLFDVDELTKSYSAIPIIKIQEFMKMLDAFASYGVATIKSADELAIELSKKGRILKDLAKTQLEEDIERPDVSSSVYDFYQGIRELIKDINIDDCADAYTQTIIFGLFIAKLNRQDMKLDRASAAASIPKNIGIIRKVFLNLADALPRNISWIVEDIIDVLNSSDIKGILVDIGERVGTRETSFIMFYEDFLSQFDPNKRKHMGVYYTPRPVVSFIANSINEILKKEFHKTHGFAEDDVTVLDPAAGTGTFLRMVYLLGLLELKKSGLSGIIEKKIETHFLKDIFGFEILITPYVISHMTLNLVLKKWFYNLRPSERIKVYLTNTLDTMETHTLIPFMKEITEESTVANEIKTRKRILAIIGNPPYSGVSYNKSEWIEALLKKQYKLPDGNLRSSFYEVDGAPLGEKKVWLQDDYVKFIRYAQWKIDSAGEGIIGFITNHAYLDNPTFRGMRQSLMQTFERIYIVNLHGNSLRKEKAPDGGDDENVFDIQQGVAIAIYVKSGKYKDKKIFYIDVYGTREKKYFWLDKNDWSSVTDWTEIMPVSPYYLFVPAYLSSEYYLFKSIIEIFPSNVSGIVTARDEFAIDTDRNRLLARIEDLRANTLTDDEIRLKYFKGKGSKKYLPGDTRGWKLSKVRQQLRLDDKWESRLEQILYRLFDVRWIYYVPWIVDWPRIDIMPDMIRHPNLALVTVREVAEGKFNHALVTDKMIDNRLTASNKGVAYMFPLYRYAEDSLDKSGKPNINTELLNELKLKYGKKIVPEKLLYYIYAVLNSPKYRRKYAEHLKMDFPRIPFPQDVKTFDKLSEIGKTLIELHLERAILTCHTKFDVSGSNIVTYVQRKNNRIYINKTQFFEDIPDDVWNFQMCGVQVLDKWLKERKGSILGSNDVERFIRIVEILRTSNKLMYQIDSLNPV